jgi:hypothetical protein
LNDDTYDPDESQCDTSGYAPEIPDAGTVNLLAAMNLSDGKPIDIVIGEVKKTPKGYWHREAASGTEPTCEETQNWQRK